MSMRRWPCARRTLGARAWSPIDIAATVGISSSGPVAPSSSPAILPTPRSSRISRTAGPSTSPSCESHPSIANHASPEEACENLPHHGADTYSSIHHSTFAVESRAVDEPVAPFSSAPENHWRVVCTGVGDTWSHRPDDANRPPIDSEKGEKKRGNHTLLSLLSPSP